ncbi:Aminoacyl-tRNA synthetase, class II [Cynara cardunculus var. scolymus]|uniref:asparagine--tRNA ligase n=1 Tax=Cynara cardunculus var. scolymus TaxID=59895 RepID=A0A103YH31_CYNCS|nr:Aminoacyl-tRNA synthetase, class II [Cynara cardunculus var. scolymus]
MADDGVLPVDKLTISDTVEEAEFSQRVLIRSILGRPDGGAGLAGKTLKVGGWVKKGREQGKGSFAFLELNDGSCPANLQLIIYSDVAPLGQFTPTGTCLHVEGVLQMPPEDKQGKQSIELRVSKVLDVGTVDPANCFPHSKCFKCRICLVSFNEGEGLSRNRKKKSYNELSKLAEKTNSEIHEATNQMKKLISAIARIRNALAFATHTFFQKHGFLYVHTPIITTSDCEGAGEMFQVTTLINEAEKLEKELIKNPPPSQEEVDMAKGVVKEKGEIVAKLKSDKAGKSVITAAVAELTKAKENLSKLEERFNQKPGIPKKDGKVDYGQDFFARQAFLTVSGQLQVETFACALSSVYTFGPTFRAEHSHTSRHLAEFWMVEPEIAFADIEDDMKCAEAYVRFLCQWLLDNCYDDMEFMAEKFDKKAIQRLQMVASTNFIRLSYTEAVKILEEAVSKGHKFENKVEWGIDLASEHEKYLTETKFESPVIVYNYPKGIKAFYMKVNPDNKTVAAMDVLVPKVGFFLMDSWICFLEQNLFMSNRIAITLEHANIKILEMGLPLEPYEWYLDLRRYGTVKHSGFGLGFERMILFATGIDNIRDVIPFPRYPGRADL